MLFLVVLALVYVGRMFGYGMDLWAASGEQGAADRVARGQLSFTWGLLGAALGAAGLAALLRARWTAGLQLFGAAVLFVFAVQLGHAYNRSHPAPPPPPKPGYTPCYSGSGRCD
ncbi:hypothetical protein VM95_25895 [Streptomyces rubellomurinus]|uniref:DUF6234 domain-containing protein n=1 Tax=Streptomyces rubellomurinus (strain ATCC 31215) TaxID=359131 RepID=A0A0F2TD49_STRR3|nr:hypothetical protein VM95_25895 [Streptomyces rubellomurinus]